MTNNEETDDALDSQLEQFDSGVEHGLANANTTALRALVAEWRDEAKRHRDQIPLGGVAGTIDHCANELEAALATPEAEPVLRCDIAAKDCKLGHPKDDGSNVCFTHYDVMENHPVPEDERIIENVLIWGKFTSDQEAT